MKLLEIVKRIAEDIREISIRSIIFNNFWLKLVALGIAIITWLYVNGEITRGIRV